MSLDIRAGAPAPPNPPTPSIEFLTIVVMPLIDGQISVSLKSTTFDEGEFDLVDENIAEERVATLEELFALMRAYVRIAPLPQ
jgi:hypothetical protein